MATANSGEGDTGGRETLLSGDVYDIPEEIREQEIEYANSLNQLGFTPGWDRTSDFMIGRVAVSLIMPESTGNLYNWTKNEIDTVTSETWASLNWWAQKATIQGVSLEFVLDGPNVVPTSYEPITHPLGPPDNVWCGDDDLWIGDVMDQLGYNQFNDYVLNVRDYANTVRDTYSADWAFVVFVANAVGPLPGSPDGGAFATGPCPGNSALIGIAYRPGPMYITNDNPASFETTFLDELLRHEEGHLFGALDEVPGAWPDCFQASSCSKAGGYLSITNGNCRYLDYGTPPPPPTPVCSTDIFCVMQAGGDGLCPSSVGHIGWRDTDNDGLPDPIDTYPDLTINTYPTTPSTTPKLFYDAIAQDIPYPTTNPDYIPVTINNVRVEYNLTNLGNGQSSGWITAAPADGAWDSSYEEDFQVLICENGNYTVQLRAINEVNNISSPTLQHNISINLAAPCETSYLPFVTKDGNVLLPNGTTESSSPYPPPSTPEPTMTSSQSYP